MKALFRVCLVLLSLGLTVGLSASSRAQEVREVCVASTDRDGDTVAFVMNQTHYSQFSSAGFKKQSCPSDKTPLYTWAAKFCSRHMGYKSDTKLYFTELYRVTPEAVCSAALTHSSQ